MKISLLASLFVICFAFGCSDDSQSTKEDGSTIDSGIDVGVNDNGISSDQTTTAEQNVGMPCQDDTECQAGSPNCVLGICTVSCIGDDGTTEDINEDSCPDQNTQVCSTITIEDAEYQYCLLKCTPNETSNPCPQGTDTACSPASVAYSGVINVAVCWDSPCASNQDCPVGLNTECQDDTECNTANGEFCDLYNGLCALEGNCNVQTGLCGAHTHGKTDAKIGDSCNNDTDCANDQFCDYETDLGNGVIVARNGYCTKIGCTFEATLTSAACPTGSGCNRSYYGGLCQKQCTLSDASSCRGVTGDYLGDYECYSWDQMGEGEVMYADVPVCDYAPYVPCDFLSGTGLECKDIGDATNSTNMACRNPATNAVLTDPYDPNGLCLDDTASGPIMP